jgi:hypothetical protein
MAVNGIDGGRVCQQEVSSDRTHARGGAAATNSGGAADNVHVVLYSECSLTHAYNST